MACYSGTTVSIARTVTWHALESFWDDLSGQSPIMQILREINIREEQVGLAKTAWTGTGIDPADGAATTAAKHNAKDGAAWWVEAMDAMLDILATSGTVGDDGIRWTITGVSTIRSTFLASVGSSSGTRLANAKLEDRWKLILTALRTALDAIDEKVSAAWSGDWVYVHLSSQGEKSSGYRRSWNSGCKTQRAEIGGGALLYNAFDWFGGAGGNTFAGVSSGHDMAVTVTDAAGIGAVAPGGDDGPGARSALCVGHTFHWADLFYGTFGGGGTWDQWDYQISWEVKSPDDDGYLFGHAEEELPYVDSTDVAYNVARWEEFADTVAQYIGWYCGNTFEVEFLYTISCLGELAPGSVVEVAALLTTVAVAGVANEAEGDWDVSSYLGEHDETDAIDTHTMGARTLSMTAANVTTAPDASAPDTPTAGNFSAAAAQCGIVVNGSAPLLWVDGVVSGGTDDLGYIKLPACVDALGRYHLE